MASRIQRQNLSDMPVFEFSKHLYLDQVDIYIHTLISFLLWLSLTHASLFLAL